MGNRPRRAPAFGAGRHHVRYRSLNFARIVRSGSLSGRVDAIRDSRIAGVVISKGKNDCFDRRRRTKLSQSEPDLTLRVSKRTMQEWEIGRAEPRRLARDAIMSVIGH